MTNSVHSFFRYHIIPGLIVLILISTNATATDYTWIQSGNGNFMDSSSWSPTGVPNDNQDTATFSLGGYHYVGFNASSVYPYVTNKSMEVTAGEYFFDLVNYQNKNITYILDPPTTMLTIAAQIGTSAGPLAELKTGCTGNGDGAVDARGALMIAVAEGSNGKLTLGSSGKADWTSSYTTWVGLGGTGTLILDYGDLTDGGAFIGSNETAHGTVEVGTSCDWNNNGTLIIGSDGTGILINEGQITTDADVYIARNPGSTGTATAENMLWSITGTLYVGGDDSGAGGNGSLNVTGDMFTSGRVTVDSGITVRSPGTITMDDGTLRSNGQLNSETGASIDLEGGTLMIDESDFTPTPGTFNWTSGTLSFLNDLSLTPGGALNAIFTLGAYKALDVENTLRIGPETYGQLTANSGADITSTSGFIGSSIPGSTFAVATITGNGTTWTMDGDLTVEAINSADLLIGGQAAVTNNNAWIASTAGTTADVDLSDNWTTWTCNDSMYLGGSATALGGSGTLNLITYAKIEIANLLKVWDNFTVTLTDGRISTSSMNVTGTINTTGSSVLLMQNGTLEIPGGTVWMDEPGSIDILGGDVDITEGGTLHADIFGNQDTQVTLRDAGSHWSMPGYLRIPESEEGVGHIGSLTLNEGTTVTVGGDAIIDDINLFNLNGGTINAQRTDIIDADFVDYGTINGDFATTGSVAPTNTFTAGNTDSFSGVEIGGSLTVGAHTVTLNKRGFFTIGNSTSITGGTLNVPGGAALPVGSSISAYGTINGRIAAQSGSTIEALGTLTLGDDTSPAGFLSDGELYVDDQTVTLKDANEAVLGSLTWLGLDGTPGTLTSDFGFILDFGYNLVGHGTVDSFNDPYTPVINNGSILGDSMIEPIELTGYVKGVGEMDNVLITGTDAPGFSPATVYRGTMIYQGSLEIEIGGISAGSEHDQIHHSGTALLGGELYVDLIDGFIPAIGDSFTIMTAQTVSNEFATEMLPVLSADMTWNVEYRSDAVILHVVQNCPGDLDDDGDIDLEDYAIFAPCLQGPSTPVTGDCDISDLDGDTDCDLEDFAVFSECFNP